MANESVNIGATINFQPSSGYDGCFSTVQLNRASHCDYSQFGNDGVVVDWATAKYPYQAWVNMDKSSGSLVASFSTLSNGGEMWALGIFAGIPRAIDGLTYNVVANNGGFQVGLYTRPTYHPSQISCTGTSGNVGDEQPWMIDLSWVVPG